MTNETDAAMLDRLEGLYAKATPGEWQRCENGNIVPAEYSQDCEIFAYYENDAGECPNADYACAMHNAIPRLIALARDGARLRSAPVGIVRERGGSLAAIIGELPPKSIAPEVGQSVRLVPEPSDGN